MRIPKRHRRALAIVAIALLFALLVEKASSQRASNYVKRVANAYATGVANELFGETAESAATPLAPVSTADVTANGLLGGGPPHEFPFYAEAPAAYGAFGTSTAASPGPDVDNVDDPTGTVGSGRLVATSTASHRPGTAGRRRTVGSGGGANIGSSSGSGVARVPPTAGSATNSQAESGSATAETEVADAVEAPLVEHPPASPVVDAAAALAVNPFVTSLLSALAEVGESDGAVGTDEGFATSPNQGDPHTFGGLADDLLAPDALSAVGADPVTDEANPTMLGAGAALGLYSPALLAQAPGPADLADQPPGGPGFVVVLSEPAALAVFGVGLLALGSRLRRARRARSVQA